MGNKGVQAEEPHFLLCQLSLSQGSSCRAYIILSAHFLRRQFLVRCACGIKPPSGEGAGSLLSTCDLRSDRQPLQRGGWRHKRQQEISDSLMNQRWVLMDRGNFSAFIFDQATKVGRKDLKLVKRSQSSNNPDQQNNMHEGWAGAF